MSAYLRSGEFIDFDNPIVAQKASELTAGLRYQRLSVDAKGPPFCLHGLNAVFLRKRGWIRIDARGDKPGVSADFRPPVEKLAYQAINAGEADLPEIWAAPLGMVIEALANHKTIEQVYQNLPDTEIVRPANIAMTSYHQGESITI